MEIMGNHGCLKPNSSVVMLDIHYPKSRSQVSLLIIAKHIMKEIFTNMNLGKKIVGVIAQADKGSQVKLSKGFLLCIHVTQRKSSLENKVKLRQLGSSFYQ
jgi:hypothetical protein